MKNNERLHVEPIRPIDGILKKKDFREKNFRFFDVKKKRAKIQRFESLIHLKRNLTFHTLSSYKLQCNIKFQKLIRNALFGLYRERFLNLNKTWFTFFKYSGKALKTRKNKVVQFSSWLAFLIRFATMLMFI